MASEQVGKNFSAGMSGGIAWVYDPAAQLRYKANFAEPMRDFERLGSDSFEEELKGYIQEHLDATQSPVADRILANWEQEREAFVQVFPLDYKRARKQAMDADSWKGREEMPKSKVPLDDVMGKDVKVDAATPTEQEIATKFNKLRGFVEIERKPEPYRDPEERRGDWGEIYTPVKAHDLERKRQSARCMDCGTPFCQTHSVRGFGVWVSGTEFRVWALGLCLARLPDALGTECCVFIVLIAVFSCRAARSTT